MEDDKPPSLTDLRRQAGLPLTPGREDILQGAVLKRIWGSDTHRSPEEQRQWADQHLSLVANMNGTELDVYRLFFKARNKPLN